MTVPVLQFGPAGTGVHVDLDRFAETRCLVQGVSGSGKSTLIRSLLEQTHGKVPHLVIDSEGDFVTLREKFDYVLVGRGGDVPISVKTAKVTVRRLAELNVSAIFDLSELRFPERREWVRICCEELVHLPRTMWQTRLVVLDEAHIYCPERGSGESVSTAAVIDVVTLGRKRGLVPICATQRLSKLHKDAAGELLNKLIGYTDDVDLQRAGDQLGMTKEQRNQLKLLDTHTFYAYGPAISRAPVLVRTQMPTTKPPARGQDRPSAPPARTAVQKVLAQLADLPKQAEEEAKSIEDLRRQNGELTRRIRQLEKGAPAAVPVEKKVVDRAAVDRAVVAAVSAERKRIRPAIVQLQRAVTSMITADIPGRVGAIAELLQESSVPASGEAGGRQEHTSRKIEVGARGGTDQRVGAQHRTAPDPRRSPAASSSSSSLPKGEKAMLIAIAQYPEGASRDQLSVLTGYKRSSRDTYIQRLLSSGCVDVVGSLVRATDQGIEALGSDYEPLPTGDDLQDYWLNRLPEGERKVLDVLIAAYPSTVYREEIDDITGYKRSSRDTYLQRLRSRKLVDDAGRGGVRASKNLFDGGAS